MSRRHRITVLAVSIATAGVCVAPVYAIEKGNGAAVVNSPLNYVGKWQSEVTPAGGVVGTATVIRPGVVLGAAHLVQSNPAPNDDQFLGFSDRFELGGTQYVGLPVLEPNYAGQVGYGNEDLALLILANGQNANSAPANTLATPAQETAIINQINGVGVAAAPENVTLVGWQSADNVTSPTLLQGTSQIKMAPAGANAGEWTFDTTLAAGGGYPGSNWVDQGDSGGPTFTTINGATVLIGVHSYRAAGGAPANATIDVDTSTATTNNYNFIQGQGDGGSTLDYLNVGGGGSWNTAASWSRRVAVPLNPAVVPLATDIAILDPTGNFDVGTTVTLNGIATNNLNGLLNDVTLDVSNAGAVNVTGLSGATNTGTMNIRQAGTSAAISYQLDNEGTYTVQNSATSTVGASIPGFIQMNNASNVLTNYGTLTMMNGSNGAVNVLSGATLNVNTGMENYGTMNVNNNGGAAATMNVGKGLPVFVGTAASPGSSPVGIYNGVSVRAAGGNAVINVGSGGNLNITNGAANQTAILYNDFTGIVNVNGTVAAPANLTADQIVNEGAMNNTGGGTLTANVLTNNGDNTGIVPAQYPSITVSNNMGVANLGWLTNNDSGIVTVNSGGTINTTRPKSLVAGHSLDNSGDIQVNGGGTFNVTGTPGADGIAANNTENITIVGNLQAGSFNTTGGALNNTGEIAFAGKVPSVAQATFTNANLVTGGAINGTGSLVFSENSSYVNRAITGNLPTLNTQNIAVVFDDASDAGAAPVTMEAPTEDQGDDISVLSDDPSSFYDFSIVNDSRVELTDNTNNSGSGEPEAIYTYEFGIDSTSVLDLNGLDVYYDQLDMSEGGLSGTVYLDGGELIQLPEPGTAVLLVLAAPALLRRRRALQQI